METKVKMYVNENVVHKSSVFISKCFVVIIILVNSVTLQLHRTSNHSSWTPAQIRFALANREILPNVVKKVAKNIRILEVAYGLHKMEVEFGGKQTQRQIEKKPTSIKWDAVEDAYYTLMFLGPDCPTFKNHHYRSWRHWTVVNILGNDVESGETITPYEGVEEIYKPGIHRLVFLLYRQPGIDKIDFTHSKLKTNNRSAFQPKKFTWKYKFWDPIAVNFFYCKNLP